MTMPLDVSTRCVFVLFSATYNQALQLRILCNDPLTPLTLAYMRDSSDALIMSMAGAPTLTSKQGYLQCHVHYYQLFQRPGIGAYLLH